MDVCKSNFNDKEVFYKRFMINDRTVEPEGKIYILVKAFHRECYKAKIERGEHDFGPGNTRKMIWLDNNFAYAGFNVR